MEILCKSEYQNVYRVKDGVLFVVNKFKYIKNKKGYMYHLSNIDRKNSKTYKKGCKDLKILTFDVNTCEYIEFANYSEYRKFVLKSRQKKEYRKRKEL